MTLRILKVTAGSHLATVQFADGHIAHFIPCRGNAQVLQTYRLECGNRLVAIYHSPYQQPRYTTTVGLWGMSPGYTPVRVIQYWQAARNYVYARRADHGERQRGVIVAARTIIGYADRDLKEICDRYGTRSA